MFSFKTFSITPSHLRTYSHMQTIMTRCFQFLFALAWKAAIV